MSQAARGALALAVFVAALGSPGTARADADDPRIAGYLALGFGGDADLITGIDFLDGSLALDPTVGFGVRFEAAVQRYVALGASFELLTLQWEGMGSTREEVLDFDGFLRSRYPIELPDAGLTLEPYLSVPVGFSMAVLEDQDGDGEKVWPGWNIGVLAGLYVVLEELPLGFFVELGWRHHQVYNEEDTIGGEPLGQRIVTNQLALQLGAAFVLE